jgi:hypothetical protein
MSKASNLREKGSNLLSRLSITAKILISNKTMCPIEEKTTLRWKRSEVKVFEILDS